MMKHIKNIIDFLIDIANICIFNEENNFCIPLYSTNDNCKKWYSTYIIKANIRNKKFDLTKKEFYKIVSKDCYSCGRKSNNNMGIDRYDNDIDYTYENSKSCCSTCNIMKSDHTFDFFINHCKKIFYYNYDNIIHIYENIYKFE